ncbi:MAG: SDR family NAD(P)-dependent oxidoreductase [Actinomycetota bacterium]
MAEPRNLASENSAPETGTILAVVTGASRGIGAGIASAASDAGAIVATCNRGASTAPHQLTADLSDPAAWATFADWYNELVDSVQPAEIVMVHNAATITPIGFAGEVDPDAYRANVLLNSAAPQVLGERVVATARRTGIPTVLGLLSSGTAHNPWAGWTSYGAAKAAVNWWVQLLGLEQAERDHVVRAFSVAPGVVATDMQAEIRASDPDAFPDVDRFQSMHDDGTLSSPEAVGATIWRIARASWWDNGANLDVRNLPEH